MKGLNLKKIIKNKVISKLLLTLLMVISIFGVSSFNDVKEVTAEATGTLELYSDNKNYIDVNAVLYNHDKNTVTGYSFILKDSNGAVKGEWLEDLSGDNYETTKSHRFEDLKPNKTYYLDYVINTPYASHVDEDYVMNNGAVSRIKIRMYCLERLEVTKTWDDNENASNNRLSYDEYLDILEFYEDGVKKTPTYIEKISDSGNIYKFYVYGINIRRGIRVDENPVPDGYELTETNGSDPFFDSDGSRTGGVGTSDENPNVSKASLKNKDFAPLKIKLKKVDSDDNSIVLAGVKFDIINKSGRSIPYNGNTYADGEVIATLTTDANGEASIEGLAYSGTYLVKETYNPNPGYTDPQYEGTFSSKDITNTEEQLIDIGLITNIKAGFGGLKVIKFEENDSTQLIENAIFELYNVTGKTIVLKDGTEIEDNGKIGSTYTTGDDGTFTIDEILPNDGTYKLVEIGVPSGYLIINEETTVNVTKDTTTEAYISNREIPYGHFAFNKIDDDGQPLLGSILKLIYAGDNSSNPPIYLADGSGPFNPGDCVYTMDLTQKDSEVTEDIFPMYTNPEAPSNSWKKTKFELIEYKVPDGYYVGSGQKSKYDAWKEYPLVYSEWGTNLYPKGNTNSQNVKNYGPFSLKIIKRDNDDTEDNQVYVPGAVFAVYLAKHQKPITINGIEYNAEDEIIRLGPSGDDGVLETDKIFPRYREDGSSVQYLLKEIVVPDGYVTKNPDGINIYGNSDTGSSTITRIIKNQEIKEEYMGFYTKKKGRNQAGSNVNIDGAQFTIVNASDRAITLQTGEVIEPGDAAYVWDLDGMTSVPQHSRGLTSPTIFPMYFPDDGSPITYEFYETVIPDGYAADSKINYSNITPTQLKWIDYPMVASVTSDPFSADESYFDKTTNCISLIKNAYGEIYNYANLAAFKIIKQDYSDYYKYLPGAKFELYYESTNEYATDIVIEGKTYSSGDKIMDLVTDDDGEAVTDFIFPRFDSRGIDVRYVLREVEAPDGYYLDLTDRAFLLDQSMDSERPRPVNISNREIKLRELKIIKVDEKDPTKFLKGAVFEIYYNDNVDTVDLQGNTITKGDLITTITTNENGEASTGEVLPVRPTSYSTSYLIKEVTPPEGYPDTQQTITTSVRWDTATVKEVTIKNSKPVFAGLKLYKRDSVGGRYLEGAEFDIVYNGSIDVEGLNGETYTYGDVVATMTTDENGYAEIDRILPLRPNAITFYKIIETKYPDGYVVPDEPNVFYLNITKDSLNSEGYFEKTFYNNRDSFCIEVNKLKYPFELTDSEDKFEFEIELKDADGNPANESFYLAHNEYNRRYYRDLDYDDKETIEFVDGKASLLVGFNDLYSICDIPNGYEYTITEKPSDDWNLVVSSKSNGVYGNLEGFTEIFLNKENEELKFNLEALKKLEKATLKDKQFEFELKDSNNEVLDKQSNDADGKVVFKDVTLNTKDLELKKLNYKEASDEEKEKYSTWVSTDYAGYLIVLTKEIPDEAYTYFSGQGIVKYKDATDEQKAQHGKELSWDLGAAFYDFGSRIIYFYDLNYLDLSLLDQLDDNFGRELSYYAFYYDEELTYTINEVIPEVKEEGMTYDEHEETVKVKINGELGKELTYEIEYDEDKAIFTNKYEEPKKPEEPTPEPEPEPEKPVLPDRRRITPPRYVPATGVK